jgi:hypothetical protein
MSETEPLVFSRYPWVVRRSHGSVPPLVHIQKRKRRFGTGPGPKEKQFEEGASKEAHSLVCMCMDREDL